MTTIANDNQTKCPAELFESVSHNSLAEAVVNQLETAILDGILKPGMKLPAERVLAEQLEVSRPKLREALQVLEARSLVFINPGSGVVVAELSGEAMKPALIDLYCRHPRAIQDHLEYRKCQEVFAAQLASQRATNADREGIRYILEQMQEADDTADLGWALDLDIRFHMAIVHASHNRTLIHMMESLYELNRRGMFFSREEMLSKGNCAADLLQQHQTLGNAVIAGNTELASQAAAEHMEYVSNMLVEMLQQKERERLARKRHLP